MRHWVTFVWIFLVIVIFSVAYITTTDPYLQAKRDNSYMGVDDAPILIIEFGDYLDPVVIQIEKSMEKLRTNYSGEIKFIYKHYPLSNDSYVAAMAVECVGNQGYYREMHDKIFENYRSFNSTNVYVWADEIQGVNVDSLRQCMKVGLYEKIINGDKKIGDRLKIKNLPLIFINGARFEGMNSYDVYSSFIDKELAQQ